MPHEVSVGDFLSELLDVVEDCWLCAKLLLPLVVLVSCGLKLFELLQFFIELRDHLSLVRLLVQVCWGRAVVGKPFDLRL